MQTYSPEMPHSGLGVASFIISLVAGVGMLVLVGVATVLSAAQPGGQLDEESLAAIMIGLVLALAALAQLVAIGLGIGGLVQTGRKKVFAVLGTVFAAMSLLGALMLMLIGTALG